MISPTRPYSSQRVPNSNLLTRSSVCSREHRPLSPSKSVRFAVHLEKEMVKAWDREWTEYIPSAPPLHNAGKQNLLRVISNIWTKAVDCSLKVTIRKLYYLWNCHSWFEIVQNNREGWMEELSPKFLELGIAHMLLVSYTGQWDINMDAI